MFRKTCKQISVICVAYNHNYECHFILFSLDCVSGDIRLVGYGSSGNQGRVEMCYNNQYGTLCSYSWDINEAIIICKQLGFYGMSFITLFFLYTFIFYIGTSTAYINAYFGQGTGQILLSGLGCTGTETSLFSCSFNNNIIGSTNCIHSQDAGVACSTS